MNIVCASSLAMGREVFSTLGRVRVLPEREIDRAAIQDADALVVRSKVRVDAALLEGSRVSFVATATAGTDHVDLAYLEERGIAWASAPGCNANSVAEYIVTALFALAARHGGVLEGRTVAVVGVGHVGRRVADFARALGLRVVMNDPPRAMTEPGGGFLPLEEILPRADIVTLHVPLEAGGPFPTRGMVDCRFLSMVKPGCTFINASRGEVVDEDALLLAMDQGVVSRSVLDVFATEPRLRVDVARRADLVTPHIAGYSWEGRVKGTLMCYDAACRFFERVPEWRPGGDHGAPRGHLDADAAGRTAEDVLSELCRRACPIESDDRALRAGLVEDDIERGRHFQKLRMQYPERYEFPAWNVRLRGADPGIRARVHALGFRVVAGEGEA